MPRDGKLNVDVLVGGATIEEFNCNGKTYVEMNLQHATSYDCEYIDNTPHGVEKSNWPVTPFQVRVQNDSPTEHFWAELHLDGEYVDQRLVSPNRQAVTFKGFQDQGKVKEFLFALPRNQRVDDGDEVAASSRLGQLGSLTVRAFPATFSHTEDKWVDGKNSAFRQANKIEANKAAKDRGNDCMTGTAREGRTIGASDDSMSTAGHKKVNIWDKSKTLDKEVTVHYRQRHVLCARCEEVEPTTPGLLSNPLHPAPLWLPARALRPRPLAAAACASARSRRRRRCLARTTSSSC
jgi:hypothetical protein